MHLRPAQWQRLHQALLLLHADAAPETLSQRLMETLAQAVGTELICLDGFGTDDQVWHIAAQPRVQLLEDLFPDLHHLLPSHPLFSRVVLRRSEEPMRTTDSVDYMRQYYRTPVFNEYYRHVDLTHQLILGLPLAGLGWVACTLHRIRHDFSETDRYLLGLLGPHLQAAARHAQLLTTLRTHQPVEAPTMSAEGLTPRETQVLAALTQGLADKEISQRCGISVRTVQNHLQNIYSKLGVTSRTAALTRMLALSRQ